MSEEGNLNSASFGYAYIESGVVGCFSREEFVVELKFSEVGQVAANIVHNRTMQTVFLERTDAQYFLSAILEAAQKPEVLSGHRCTTWYYVKAYWKNLGFAEGGLLGSIDVKSSELPIEEIERFLTNLENTEEDQKIRELLSKRLHRRAIEIHREVEKFAKAKSYLERKP